MFATIAFEKFSTLLLNVIKDVLRFETVVF